MPEIIQKPITSVERHIFKTPLLEKEHDFKAEYKCSCGREIVFYNIGRPERLVKCFDCEVGK